MEAKYDHRLPQHRKRLAKNVLHVCVGFGYIIDFDFPTQEVVLKKSINENVVRVFTSVDKRTQDSFPGRKCLRVNVRDSDPRPSIQAWVKPNPLFHRKIKRVGEFQHIVVRVAKALKDAERRAARPS